MVIARRWPQGVKCPRCANAKVSGFHGQCEVCAAHQEAAQGIGEGQPSGNRHEPRLYNHKTVHHRARQYVVGAIHTNTIKDLWSIFMRSIVGSYHKVSSKYLPLYIAECEFKYNNRFNLDIFGTAIKGC